MGLGTHDITDQVARGTTPGENPMTKFTYSFSKEHMDPHRVPGALVGTGGAAVNRAG